MKKKKSSSESWNREYSFLLKSSRIKPPAQIGERVKGAVHAELNPAAWIVFCKLFALHFISGALTLLFCPQFGVQMHNGNQAILGVLNRFGEYGCMLACGALFLGSTGFFAGILLKPQEVRAIRQSRGLQWALLSFLSIGFFLSFREQESSIPIGLVLAWSIGAIFGGFSVFQLSFLLRAKVQQVKYNQ